MVEKMKFSILKKIVEKDGLFLTCIFKFERNKKIFFKKQFLICGVLLKNTHVGC